MNRDPLIRRKTAISYKTEEKTVMRGYDLSELAEEGYSFCDALFVLYQNRIPTEEEEKMLKYEMGVFMEHSMSPSAVGAIGVSAGRPNLPCAIAAAVTTFGGVHGPGAAHGYMLNKYIERAAKEGRTIDEMAKILVDEYMDAGNVVSIVDDTVDLAAAAHKIKLSKIANNSASCSSENAVALYADIYDQMIECLKAEGGYLCSTAEREKLRKYMWPDGSHLNRDIVARPATFIAEQAGLTVPEDTRFLMVIGEKIGPEDRFSGEKISPVLTVWKWIAFDDMLDRVEKILKFSGEGHSVSIHTENDERRVKLALRANVGRVVCNMPHAHANSGGWNSGLPTTDSLGCGSWAGNIFSGNINWENFLNCTLLAIPKEEYIPTAEELCGTYLEKWGRD
jgi:hypothetical protein